MNGESLAESLVYAAPTGIAWALEVRNFFVFRIVVIAVAAVAIAGELQARTLRDVLVRPVSRPSALAAKLGAIAVWIGVATGLTWLFAAAISAGLFGVSMPEPDPTATEQLRSTSAAWLWTALAFVLTWLTDVVVACIVAAVATVTRSVVLTIVGVILLYTVDFALWLALQLLTWTPQPDAGDRGPRGAGDDRVADRDQGLATHQRPGGVAGLW